MSSWLILCIVILAEVEWFTLSCLPSANTTAGSSNNWVLDGFFTFVVAYYAKVGFSLFSAEALVGILAAFVDGSDDSHVHTFWASSFNDKVIIEWASQERWGGADTGTGATTGIVWAAGVSIQDSALVWWAEWLLQQAGTARLWFADAFADIHIWAAFNTVDHLSSLLNYISINSDMSTWASLVFFWSFTLRWITDALVACAATTFSSLKYLTGWVADWFFFAFSHIADACLVYTWAAIESTRVGSIVDNLVNLCMPSASARGIVDDIFTLVGVASAAKLAALRKIGSFFTVKVTEKFVGDLTATAVFSFIFSHGNWAKRLVAFTVLAATLAHFVRFHQFLPWRADWIFKVKWAEVLAVLDWAAVVDILWSKFVTVYLVAVVTFSWLILPIWTVFSSVSITTIRFTAPGNLATAEIVHLGLSCKSSSGAIVLSWIVSAVSQIGDNNLASNSAVTSLSDTVVLRVYP